MATPGRPIDNQTRQQIQRLRSNGVSVRDTARAAQVSIPTVQKIFPKKMLTS
jgi:DNA invertase Pin-like site-specific DNA recombinase